MLFQSGFRWGVRVFSMNLHRLSFAQSISTICQCGCSKPKLVSRHSFWCGWHVFSVDCDCPKVYLSRFRLLDTRGLIWKATSGLLPPQWKRFESTSHFEKSKFIKKTTSQTPGTAPKRHIYDLIWLYESKTTEPPSPSLIVWSLRPAYVFSWRIITVCEMDFTFFHRGASI